jgi:hypothetical protein
MTKEKFLTIRWNNLLSLVLGIPALIFVVFALASAQWTDKTELIVLSVIGALY